MLINVVIPYLFSSHNEIENFKIKNNEKIDHKV